MIKFVRDGFNSLMRNSMTLIVALVFLNITLFFSPDMLSFDTQPFREFVQKHFGGHHIGYGTVFQIYSLFLLAQGVLLIYYIAGVLTFASDNVPLDLPFFPLRYRAKSICEKMILVSIISTLIGNLLSLLGIAPIGIVDYFAHIYEVRSALNIIAFILHCMNLLILFAIIIGLFCADSEKPSNRKICPIMSTGNSGLVKCTRSCVFYNSAAITIKGDDKERCGLYMATHISGSSERAEE